MCDKLHFGSNLPDTADITLPAQQQTAERDSLASEQWKIRGYCAYIFVGIPLHHNFLGEVAADSDLHQ